VKGVVQGVGFRPFVYRLAHEHGLDGWVLNHSGGVEIEVEGDIRDLDRFTEDLLRRSPPLARIVSIEWRDLPRSGRNGFEIRASLREEGRYQLISPDIATCADCRRELLDPKDRRYRYPFTNCTNCGPRFTIITDIPYDRPQTTMRPFPMCRECQAEYEDPLNRRFHAQPNACPVCGPRVWFEPSPVNDPRRDGPGAGRAEDERALDAACSLLTGGGVLAVKGLGGFHLACDATNEDAVATLRARKARPAKPLAVMLATIEDVRRHALVLPEEEQLLNAPQCPIVLLRWRPESDIARLVAPGTDYLGAMLPYTPLHHILLRDAARPLVMTSGNLSEEPIACENEEAMRRLSHLADGFLMHDRDIHARYDDSVWFVPRVPRPLDKRGPQAARSVAPNATASCAQPIRRSRGYAPFPIKLPFPVARVLACGPELKNTFCLTRDEYAFVSQHIGDMENLETLEHFEASVELYKHLFRIEPQIVAYDLHPAYLSTRYALSLPSSPRTRVPVQHHHAHIASCLADNGWPRDRGPVIGVAWDGTGYGTDGHVWGGEFLVSDYGSFKRAGHFEYLPMPGGEASIRNPYRLAAAYTYVLTGRTLDPTGSASEEELRVIQDQVDKDINCPLTSAAGRLFDAVSALLGIRGQVSYEAQAAVELERAATACACASPAWDRAYPFAMHEDDPDGYGVRRQVGLGAMIRAIAADLARSVPTAEIAYRFHLAAARIIGEMCELIAGDTGIRTVALSGGCFQNRLLVGLVVPLLRSAGLTVLMHRQVPCNDGGISLGQAVIADSAQAAPTVER
jgi:hydrogenase maturation protein HypF